MERRRTPIASILADRGTAVAAALLGAIQLALGAAGLPGMPCPAAQFLRVPCPGCGLTRAVLALARGDFAAMCDFHLLAPLGAMGLLLLGAAALLPGAARAALLDRVERVELRTRIGTWIAAALILYWAWRLALGPADFLRRVAG